MVCHVSDGRGERLRAALSERLARLGVAPPVMILTAVQQLSLSDLGCE